MRLQILHLNFISSLKMFCSFICFTMHFSCTYLWQPQMLMHFGYTILCLQTLHCSPILWETDMGSNYVHLVYKKGKLISYGIFLFSELYLYITNQSHEHKFASLQKIYIAYCHILQSILILAGLPCNHLIQQIL